MAKLERRKVLRFGAGLSVGVLGFLFPGFEGLARRTPGLAAGNRGPTEANALTSENGMVEVLGPSSDLPSFVQGEVIEKLPNALVLSSPHGVAAVRFPPEATVWKEFDVAFDAIEIGDWLDLHAWPQDDGAFLAVDGSVWVNIGRRDGVVVSASSGAVVIETGKGRETLALSERLEVLDVRDGERLRPQGAAALQPGFQVGAVGVRLKEGTFRVTRIWSADFND